MKHLLFLLLSLFPLGQIAAKCANNGLNVFPSGSSIRANSLILLEGYGESQQIIKGLNKEYAVYLISGNEKIKLFVNEINEGSYRVSQALLLPEKALTEEKIYTLVIDNLPSQERLQRYNAKVGDFENINWTVNAADTEKPTIKTKIKESGKSYEVYGCGPTTYVIFDCNALDNGELLCKTTLKNLKTGQVQVYYLPVENGKIQVGHGMCFGAFSFEENTTYKVGFEIMDASINIAKNSRQTLKIIPPKSQSK